MALNPETAQAVQSMARQLAEMEREITRLRRGLVRTPQLGHSSLESGEALEVRDDTGVVRGRIGWQPDGTVALVTEGGEPVGEPTAPLVIPSIGGLRVTWDGQLADADAALPADFDHMAVHVSTSSGFTPSAATYVGTIRRAGEGGMLPVTPLPYQEHYVRLVPVTTGGVQGTPSVAVSATPLQVEGPDITAGSITAAHIEAGAVTADKLEALLVLGTTILAGVPGAARVELDEDGLRGYSDTNEVVFAVDSSGNAVFSGDVTGSEISGSRMVIGSPPGGVGVVESVGDNARLTVTAANNTRSQLRAATNQAEFSAFSDHTDQANSPAAGFTAVADSVQFVLNSVNGDPDTPGVYAIANAAGAELSMRSRRNELNTGLVALAANSGSAHVVVAPPEGLLGDAADPGLLAGFRQVSTDAPLVSLQSPADDVGVGAGRRSLLHMVGNGGTQEDGRISYYASSHHFRMDVKDGVEQSGDGLVWVADSLSIYSGRHAFVSQPLLSLPPFNVGGTWVPFTSAEWPPVEFRTGWSGRVRITITAAGRNTNTAASTLHVGFSLSGGSSVPPATSRAWQTMSKVAGSGSVDSYSKVIYMTLAGNRDYVLTPHWNISSGSPSTATFNMNYTNEIVVEPLM